MTLYVLKREYEERRQALIDNLKNNPNMDPAVQHQIYGAIKEIENFLQAIDFQIESEQQKSLNLDLQRDRPRPFVERTKKFAGKVKSGTHKVVREHIPKVTAKVTAGPKRIIKQRRDKKKLKKQIEREIRERMSQGLPTHIHEEIPPELPSAKEPELGMSGTVTDVNVSEQPNAEPAFKVEQQKVDGVEEEPTGAMKKSVKKKPGKKKAPKKKSSKKKASKKSGGKKTSRRKSSKKPTKKKASKKSSAKKSKKKSSKKKATKKK